MRPAKGDAETKLREQQSGIHALSTRACSGLGDLGIAVHVVDRSGEAMNRRKHRHTIDVHVEFHASPSAEWAHGANLIAKSRAPPAFVTLGLAGSHPATVDEELRSQKSLLQPMSQRTLVRWH